MTTKQQNPHPGPMVKGYQEQPPEAIDRVNRMKACEETILRVLDDMQKHPKVDQRWLAIGRTKIEEAFMAINRSIFQPTRASLPDDEKNPA